MDGEWEKWRTLSLQYPNGLTEKMRAGLLSFENKYGRALVEQAEGHLEND